MNSPKSGQIIGLLQVGTLFEYFDLMLYVHMALFLNELFFPQSDPHTSVLLTAFAFCSTFALRPFGAFIFGYIGDHIGRKTAIITSMLIMAVSCLTMANLPPYAQIGITAAWVVTLCRVLQGLSTLGEVIGAEIYLTETTKPPLQYVVVGLTAACAVLGSVLALGCASLVMAFGLNWRLIFWGGSIVAIIGFFARTRFNESPEFIASRKEDKTFTKLENQAPPFKAALAYFLIECGFPACFYFVYIYCGTLLRTIFAYTPSQIIHHNFTVSLMSLTSCLFFSLASYTINPLKLFRIKAILFFPIILTYPFLAFSSPTTLLLFQWLLIFFSLSNVSAYPIFFKYFPISKRFTWVSFLYALSQSLVHVITAFGMIYLTDIFGYWGGWFIMIPIAIGVMSGILYFERQEKVKPLPDSDCLDRTLQGIRA